MRKDKFLLSAIFCLATAARGVSAGTVTFAGRDWLVGEGACQSGNICAPENVWVDEDGLHLKLSTTAAGDFLAASVESVDYTRYGMHRFYVRGPVADLHKNVVLGLFTYRNKKDLRDNDFIDSDLIPLGEGEIDIELTQWGNGSDAAANSHFTVQEGLPPPPPQNTSSKKFSLTDCGGTDCYTTHYFDWQPDRIQFKSFRGHSPEPPKGRGWSIHQWKYPQLLRTGKAIPKEALPHIVMNLYRTGLEDISPDQETEIIITAADLPIERIPVLSTSAARPASGDRSAGTYYYVDYYDQDGDTPAAAQLNINGENLAMSLFDGSPSSGTYRGGPAAPSGGEQEYYFTFDDGHGGSVRLPASGRFGTGKAR